MAKPDDIAIPDDVMKAAADAVGNAPPFDFCVDVVARAILAERERCASIAILFVGQTDYDLEPEACVAEAGTAKSIAAAIRTDRDRPRFPP